MPTSSPDRVLPPRPLTALVLAAGLGTRLDPLTRLVAKPAVPLGRRSLLEHVLAWLAGNGVNDVVINLHHLPATVTSLVGDGSHQGLRVRYSWEREVLGSAGGPRRALSLLQTDPFLIVNGDTLCDAELSGLLDAHDRMAGDVTMAVVPNPAPTHYNGIRASDDGVALGFVPRGEADGSWHFVGVQVARQRIFAGLEDGARTETVAGFYRDVIRMEPGRIRVYPVRTSFLDVGTPADYLDACLALATGDASQPGAPGPQRTARVDPARQTVIWSDAEVPASVQLENAIVAGRVTLPAGFAASNVVIVPAEVVTAADRADIVGNLAVFPLRPGRTAA